MNIGYENFQSQPFSKSIRSSYKSLVRWGQKNLSFSHVNKDNPCRDSFLQVKAFHKKIAGRTTRSDATWNIQYEMLKRDSVKLFWHIIRAILWPHPSFWISIRQAFIPPGFMKEIYSTTVFPMRFFLKAYVDHIREETPRLFRWGILTQT